MGQDAYHGNMVGEGMGIAEERAKIPPGQYYWELASRTDHPEHKKAFQENAKYFEEKSMRARRNS